MHTNPARRRALSDAAISVLAGRGARGLTFRAVDEVAGVPTGTASNYFSDRHALLLAAGLRIHERLGPRPSDLDQPPSAALLLDLLRLLKQRLTDEREVYLALLELRLEATRRPELQAALTERVRANVTEIVSLHDGHGLPGDPLVLYLIMGGLMLEELTLPGVLPADAWEGALRELIRPAAVDPAGPS